MTDRPLAIALGLLIAALLVESWLPWPYVATYLYIMFLLLAADSRSPASVRVAVGMAVAATGLVRLQRGVPIESLAFCMAGLAVAGFFAARLAQHRHDAEQSRSRLALFVSEAAHDLRNPLASLIPSVELLHQYWHRMTTDEQTMMLEAISRSATRMKRLTEDLAVTARTEANGFSLRPAPADLVAITRGIVAISRSTCPIIIEAPQRVDGVWDADRIGQVLDNLISNAVKYSPPNTAVHVTVACQKDAATVSVSDRGPGISPSEISNLFQPFSRLPAQRASQGTGLGLWTARTIAEAHGGRILVDSEPGIGSTFTLWLPLSHSLAARVAA